MSPFLVQLSFCYDCGSTFEPVREHIGTFPGHLRMHFFDMCSIDFWGHPETSTVGAVGSSTFEHGGRR